MMVGDMDAGKVIGLTGLTYGQLNYLIKQVDVLNREKTQGKARDFSFREVVFLKLASLMRSDGLRLGVINEAIGLIDQYWTNTENPAKAGMIIRMFDVEGLGDVWVWSSSRGEEYHYMNSDGGITTDILTHVPKVIYSVSTIAEELAKGDQLELKLEEMAVK